MALTNVLVKMHSIRDDDGTAFDKYKTQVYRIGDETLTKRKRTQSEYRDRRRSRMAHILDQSCVAEGVGEMLDLLDGRVNSVSHTIYGKTVGNCTLSVINKLVAIMQLN